jgi:DNA-binding Xre family transcriptional regulator
MYSTTELMPLLADCGIHLSREQVYRLVTATPQRLSTDVFAALCDVLDCTPNDLITVAVVNEQVAKAAGRQSRTSARATPSPRRSVVRRPDHE